MPTKKKDKKRKGKKRASKPKRLPSAVQGLLQYLGGQDATLQQTPRPRGAASADGGDTLSRYLAAKTQALDSMRQQQTGIVLSQQLEERYMAKRAAEDTDKKIAMLSAGLKESDIEKKKAIAELKRGVEKLGVDQLFSNLKEMYPQGIPSPDVSIHRFGSTPAASAAEGFSAGSQFSFSGGSNYGGEDFESFEPEYIEGSRAGGGAAAEMYRENAPLDRPIIRDKPRRERAVAAPRLPSRIPVVAKQAQVSAADLRASISSATGLARSRYKLPSRGQYANVQRVLNATTGSSADIISALKEAGLNIAEA
jgi:hypothetical protein